MDVCSLILMPSLSIIPVSFVVAEMAAISLISSIFTRLELFIFFNVVVIWQQWCRVGYLRLLAFKFSLGGCYAYWS